MQIAWVYADGTQIDPTIDINKIKSIGPTWGSWTTWRSCSTDNVVCHDLFKCRELTKRSFHTACNFYLPKKYYEDLERPVGVKLYEGDFGQETDHIEDIICMHLAAQHKDIVLLLGFDFSTPVMPDDRFEKHKILNYHGLARGTINGYPNTQWVVIDHDRELDKAYQSLGNLTCDKIENVIQMLV